MKLDKDYLGKHLFWILLVAFAPLVLIQFAFVIFSAAYAYLQPLQDSEQVRTKVKTVSADVRNERDLAALDVRKDKGVKVQEAVWKKASDNQLTMQTWPDRVDADDDFSLKEEMAKAAFGDPVAPKKKTEADNEDVKWRQNYKSVLYMSQFNGKVQEQFTELIKPAVLARSWDELLRPYKFEKLPTSEECWLAQEEFWVRRELIHMVKEAMDAVGKFKEVPAAKLPEAKKNKALPAKAFQRTYYKNPNWEIELILAKDDKGQLQVSGDSTITNISAGRRRLTLSVVQIQLRQLDASGKEKGRIAFPILEESGAWNEVRKFGKPVPLSGFNEKEKIEVEQLFSWATSPIKRVDRFEVGTRLALAHHYELHQSADPFKLKARKFPGEPESSGENKEAEPMSGVSAPDPNAGSGSPDGREGSGVVLSGNRTRNGIDRERYIKLTDQVRRLPVGVVLVIDQAYLPDVLLAFANSRLAFQTTQLQIQHVRGIRPYGSGGSYAGGYYPDERAGSPDGGVPVPGGEPGLGKIPGGAPGERGEAGSPDGGVPERGSGPGRLPGGGLPGGGGRGEFGPGGIGTGPDGKMTGPFGPDGGPSGSGYPDPRATVVEAEDTNLVAIGLYGVVSLYERYREGGKPKDEKKEDEPK